MNDTYVKCGIEGVKDSQSTDIHWRAKKGKASWNYRLKFNVELGHSSRSMKFPYLNITMWDKDIVKVCRSGSRVESAGSSCLICPYLCCFPLFAHSSVSTLFFYKNL